DAVVELQISDNIITNNDSYGIQLEGFYGTAEANVTISGNTINNNDYTGIYVGGIYGDAVVDISISDSIITNNGRYGVRMRIYDNADVTATVTGNTIDNNVYDGISVNVYDTAEICLTLNNNNSGTPTNPGNDGFALNNGTGNAAQFEVVDLNNVTTNNTGTFDPADPAASGDFTNVTACP
ncbi:MAG: right-handed parallel beta-helix repeat-containing protein, partial [Cyanobacteria bacterium J06629_9]